MNINSKTWELLKLASPLSPLSPEPITKHRIALRGPFCRAIMPQKNKKTSKWRYASIATHYPPPSNLETPLGITGNPLSDNRNELLCLFNVVGKGPNLIPCWWLFDQHRLRELRQSGEVVDELEPHGRAYSPRSSRFSSENLLPKYSVSHIANNPAGRIA